MFGRGVCEKQTKEDMAHSMKGNKGFVYFMMFVHQIVIGLGPCLDCHTGAFSCIVIGCTTIPDQQQ